jgi:hypothetical protein
MVMPVSKKLAPLPTGKKDAEPARAASPGKKAPAGKAGIKGARKTAK